MSLVSPDVARQTEIDRKASDEGPMFSWPAPTPGKRDLTVAAAMAVIAMVLVTFLSRDTWFFGDAWDFLFNREITDLGSLLRPHNGHLQLPVSFTYQAIYAAVGFDFWPWFWLPRLIGYAAMSYVVWLVLRRRGTDPALAWVAYAILLVLGSQGLLTTATIGHHIVIPVVAGLAAMFAAGRPRSATDRVVLAAGLTVMLYTTSLGIAAAAALGVVAVAEKKFRDVWPSFLFAGVAYGAWFVAFRETAGGAEVTADAVLRLPTLMWQMVALAMARSLALPMGYGPAVAIAVAVAIGLWIARDRLGPFEAVFGAMTFFYLTMVILVRVAPGDIAAGADRYGYMITWLIVPVVLPHIRMPSVPRTRHLLLLAIVFLVGIGNVALMRDGIDEWQTAARSVRDRMVAVGVLLADGEPNVAEATLDVAFASGVAITRLETLLDEGWVPDAAETEEDAEVARGIMRFHISNEASADLADCTTLARTESTTLLDVTNPRMAIAPAGASATARLEWLDGFGRGTRVVALDDRTLVRFPSVDDALVTVTATAGRVVVCSDSFDS